MTITLVERPAELAPVIERAARAARVALDVEADGLHSYRAKLCVLQLAWREGDAIAVAVVDTLAVPAAPLAPLLGEGGPIKVLHDLTFDARLLADAGAPLARVRDTSVAARLLGFTATGLAALLASELGVAHDKGLQHHDWARRPLQHGEIAYLAGDVRHLLDLDERFARRAEEIDVAAEIADECAYKLDRALAPPRDARPAYARIKGAGGLDATGRAVLRRLVEAREAVAEALDVPAFKVIQNEALLDLAEKRPADARAIAAVKGATSGHAGANAPRWIAAIAQGIADGGIPEEHRGFFDRAPEPREIIARRRKREAQITAWRKAEAAQRGVDPQVVLPGHCADDLVAALLAFDAAADREALVRAVAAIPGLGARRRERYLAALTAFADSPA
jgi:ribonuclease D